MDIQIPTYEDDSIVRMLLTEFNMKYDADFELTNFEDIHGVGYATVSSLNFSQKLALKLGIEYGLLIRKLRDEGKVA